MNRVARLRMFIAPAVLLLLVQSEWVMAQTQYKPENQKAESAHSAEAIPSSKTVVYVASPLGFAESTRSFMNDKLLPGIESTGVEVEDPWKETPQMKAQLDAEKEIMDLHKRRTAWQDVVQTFGSGNAHSIEHADGVVAVLDGVDVDSGTAAEVGYATGLGKWVIGYRQDFRRTGEDETSEVNLQLEYFISKNGGLIVHSLDDLEAALRDRSQRKAK